MEYDFTNDKKKMYKLGLVFVGLLSIFVFVKIVGEARSYRFIGSNPEVRSAISVSGKGEVFAVPDIATFTYGVLKEAKDVKTAQDEATKIINSTLSFLKEKDIDEKDIKTLNYNINPKYEYIREACTAYYCPGGKSVLTGYEVSQTISVKVRKTDESGTLIAGLGELGATNISSLEFSIDDEDALFADARAQAIKEAKQKAARLAKDLDVKLVRVIEFSENSYDPIYRMYDTKVYGMGGASPESIAPEIPTGENKITSGVTITYEIR